MDDENYNQDEATERAKLDQDAFDRLPPAVKLATLLKQENSKKAQGGYIERRAMRAKGGALFGAVILFFPHVPAFGMAGLALATILGALSGYLVVMKELHQTTAVLVFGGGAAALDLIFFISGQIIPGMMGFLIMTWVFIMGAGVLLAIWAKKERDKTDAF